MKTKGFLSPVLIGGIAAAVVVGGLGIALKVQSARLDSAKATLEACSSRYNEVLRQIKAQNEAVDALISESKKAEGRANRAAKAAEERAKGLATRLAQLRRGKPRTTCEAGDAVEDIRNHIRGLK